MPPKVSVVVPTYNRAGILHRALNSVLQQTYMNFELIVVDDHSGDGTPLAIAKFEDDTRVRSFRHEANFGQSRALNTGIAAARGEYVAFLDDDDEWLPTKLASQVAILDNASSKVGLVYGWRLDIDEQSNRPQQTVRRTQRGDIFELMLGLDTPVPPSSWLVRTSVARALRGFDEKVLPNDVDFICRLSEQGWHVAYVPEIVLRKYSHTRGQMVDETPENLARRAAFIRRHQARFKVELRDRPSVRARVHLRLAHYEFRYQRIKGILSVANAFLADPSSLNVKVGRYSRRLYYLLRDATRTGTSVSRSPSDPSSRAQHPLY